MNTVLVWKYRVNTVLVWKYRETTVPGLKIPSEHSTGLEIPRDHSTWLDNSRQLVQSRSRDVAFPHPSGNDSTVIGICTTNTVIGICTANTAPFTTELQVQTGGCLSSGANVHPVIPTHHSTPQHARHFTDTATTPRLQECCSALHSYVEAVYSEASNMKAHCKIATILRERGRADRL